MSELGRLLDDANQDSLARVVLRSASDDRPEPGAILGVAAALGVGTALVKTAAAHSAVRIASDLAATQIAGSAGVNLQAAALGGASSASLPLTLLFVKHLGIGLAAGALAIGGVTYAIEREKPAPATNAASQSSVGRSLRAKPQTKPLVSLNRDLAPVASPLEEAAPSGVEPVRFSAEERDLAVRRSVRAVPVSGGSAALSSAVQPATALPTAAFDPDPQPISEKVAVQPTLQARARDLKRQLAAEVVLLDRARAALLSGEPASALGVLQEYDSQPRSGTLEPETLVLRVQALHGSGDRAAATRLARRFIQRYPESRHVEAMRGLADQNP